MRRNYIINLKVRYAPKKTLHVMQQSKKKNIRNFLHKVPLRELLAFTSTIELDKLGVNTALQLIRIKNKSKFEWLKEANHKDCNCSGSTIFFMNNQISRLYEVL